MQKKLCQIITDKKICGLHSLRLENDLIQATILTEFGAKLHSLIYKPTQKEFLYHHPRCLPRQPVYGVNVDNWWSGGIDEAIPTGHACAYQGEEYPYLGEVWSLPWKWEITENTGDEIEIHLSCRTIIAPLQVERWYKIKKGDSKIHIRHKVTNMGYHHFDFLWGIHPAFDINPNTRIDIPAKSVWVAESNPNSHLGSRGTTYNWPFAKENKGNYVDMRLVPEPKAGWHELHHAIELTDGWLAVTDTTTGFGVGMTFSENVFSSIWLWLVYGGWRELYCASVEIWSGYPAKLSEAIENQRVSHLEAGAILETETCLIVYQGVVTVDKITRDGVVIGKLLAGCN
jgi:galactose mutarotase-like enzyme